MKGNCFCCLNVGTDFPVYPIIRGNYCVQMYYGSGINRNAEIVSQPRDKKLFVVAEGRKIAEGNVLPR